MGDPAFAGYVGTALAIASKLDVSTAMAIAVPLGTVATVLWIGKMTVNSFFAHWADREVQKGNVDRVAFINIVPPQILLSLIHILKVKSDYYIYKLTFFRNLLLNHYKI